MFWRELSALCAISVTDNSSCEIIHRIIKRRAFPIAAHRAACFFAISNRDRSIVRIGIISPKIQ